MLSGLTRAVEAGDIEAAKIKCAELRELVADLNSEVARLRAERDNYRSALQACKAASSAALLIRAAELGEDC